MARMARSSDAGGGGGVGGTDQSDSIDKSSSQISIGFPERSDSIVNTRAQRSNTFQSFISLPSDKNLPKLDQCCLAIYCIEHRKLLTATLKNKGLFLPNFILRPTDSWIEIAEQAWRKILQEIDPNRTDSIYKIHEQLSSIFRIQLPKIYPNYLCRIIYSILIKHSDLFDCSQSKNSSNLYVWLGIDEIQSNQSLWGIELVDLIDKFQDQCSNFISTPSISISSKPLSLVEFDMKDATKMINDNLDDHIKHKALLLSAKFNLDEIHKLFNEFVVQCFPSQFMTFCSFKIFLNKLGWSNDDDALLRMVFHSFVKSGRSIFGSQKTVTNDEDRYIGKISLPFLTFDQLILGLAAMDERADHRGDCLRFRLHYIFHFYDIDQDGRLNPNEINLIVADIKLRNKDNDVLRNSMVANNANELDNFAREIHRRNGSKTDSKEIECLVLDDFLQCTNREKDLVWISQLTETLFRSNLSAIDISSVKFEYRFDIDQTHILKIQTLLDQYEEICERCRLINFNLCAHGIKINEKGSIVRTIKFKLSPLYKDTPFIQELNLSDQDFETINSELHRLSIIAVQLYSSTSLSIFKLRKTSSKIIKRVRQILKMAKEIVRKDPLIIRCSSPCIVFSELWSNIHNLHLVVSTIGRMFPFVNANNMIFLGNFYDPDSSLGSECLIYLFCLKILMPNRVFLLRGSNEFLSHSNHQSRSVFQRECIEMFGLEILNQFYEIFDLLPIVAVVDEKIFASKNGFPSSNNPIDKIEFLNPKHRRTPITKMNSELNEIV
ncbi:hypothetical protein QR98_0021280 [Sarcoptes scabiei]|nr:hypothetical protein QR98_0021280 [Sarcoptes scabiei]